MSKIVYIAHGIPLTKANVDEAYAESVTLQPFFYRLVKKLVKQNMPWVDEVLAVNESKYNVGDPLVDYSLKDMYDSGSLYIAREIYEHKILDKYPEDTIFILAPGNVFPVKEIKKANFIGVKGPKVFGTVVESPSKEWSILAGTYKNSSTQYIQPKEIVVFSRATLDRVHQKTYKYKICNGGFTKVDPSIFSILEVIKGAQVSSLDLVEKIREENFETYKPIKAFSKFESEKQIGNARANFIQTQLEKRFLKAKEETTEAVSPEA